MTKCCNSQSLELKRDDEVTRILLFLSSPPAQSSCNHRSPILHWLPILLWHYIMTLYYDTTLWHNVMTLHHDTTLWYYIMTIHYDTTLWHHIMTIPMRNYIMTLHYDNTNEKRRKPSPLLVISRRTSWLMWLDLSLDGSCFGQECPLNDNEELFSRCTCFLVVGEEH